MIKLKDKIIQMTRMEVFLKVILTIKNTIFTMIKVERFLYLDIIMLTIKSYREILSNKLFKMLKI
jgi:hypothetical protein